MRIPMCSARVCFCKCDFVWIFAIALLVIFGNIASAETVKDTMGPYKAAYVKNYDGDTMTMQVATWHNQVTLAKLRLYGVDTPEIKGGCAESKLLAKSAKKFTMEALKKAKTIKILVVAVDNFGRYVSRVVIDDDKELSMMLLDAGLARPYKNLKKKPNWCKPKAKEHGA